MALSRTDMAELHNRTSSVHQSTKLVHLLEGAFASTNFIVLTAESEHRDFYGENA